MVSSLPSNSGYARGSSYSHYWDVCCARLANLRIWPNAQRIVSNAMSQSDMIQVSLSLLLVWQHSTLSCTVSHHHHNATHWTQYFIMHNQPTLSNWMTKRAHQEMRYPNVTWHISYLFTYLPLNYDTPVLPEYFLSNAYGVPVTYLMDVGLRKAPCVSCYYPLSVFLAYTSLLSIGPVSRFIQAQLTQRDREHTVSWNHVKCCTHVPQMGLLPAKLIH